MDVKALILAGVSLVSSLLPNSLSNQPLPTPIPSEIPVYETVFIPQLSLETIFAKNHSWTEKLPEEETIALITTGDVIPARTVNWKMTTYNDFAYPFAKTAEFLKNSDLTLINLEAPLVANCPITTSGMIFCGSQRFAEGLKLADIDVVNLANNHTLNYGPEGVCQTINLLENNEILASGFPENLDCLSSYRQSLAIKEAKGLRFGFIGFDILPAPETSLILSSIQQAKNQVDFLVVSFHWGAEYQRFPAPETVSLAQQTIEAGGDLVVGNHPHWYQPIEIYKDKVIVYAQGNFIFDQEWSLETKKGYLSKYTIYKGKVVDVQLFPIFIEDYSQAFLLEGEEKDKILKDLKEISLSHKNLRDF